MRSLSNQKGGAYGGPEFRIASEPDGQERRSPKVRGVGSRPTKRPHLMMRAERESTFLLYYLAFRSEKSDELVTAKVAARKKPMNPVTDEKQTTSTTSTGADDQAQGKPLSSRPKAGKSAKPAKGAAKKGATKKNAASKERPARAAKKASPAKQPAKKAADRSNKKAEVIAMMKSAKGAILTEIMAATGWQAHTVRGFVSILGSKGGHTIESSKSASGERTYKIAK